MEDNNREKLIEEIKLLKARVAAAGNESGKEALRQEYKQLLEIFDNLNSGVAIYEVKDEGEDFIFTYINKAGENFSKLKREDIIGRSVLQVFPGIKKMGLFEVFRQVWKTGEAQHHPSSVYQDDRIFQWVENHVYKLPDGKIAAIYDDITDRKKMEEENKIFSDAIASAFDCFMITDKSGDITYANESACAIFGYTSEEFLKLNITKLDADPEVAKKVMREVTAEGKWAGEVTNIKKNGEKFNSFLSVFIIRDDEGNPKGAMGILRDVTELRTAQKRLKTVFNGIYDGIAVTNSKTKRFVMINKALMRMLGYEEGEVKEFSISDIHSKDALSSVYKELEKQTKNLGEFTKEIQVKRKDGSIFYVDLNAIPIMLDGANCVVGVFRDVTGRIKSKEKERKYLYELEVFYKASMGREERIMELKKENEALKKELKK